jgi:hypothetical protein
VGTGIGVGVRTYLISSFFVRTTVTGLSKGVITITDEQTLPTPDSVEEQSSAEPESQVSTEGSQEQPTVEAKGQSENETFFDPNQLPEELVPVYKGMQSAYTKKTQELAEQRKEFEALKQKADSFSKYEQYIPLIEEMSKGQTQQNPEMAALEQDLRAKGYNDDAIEMMKLGVNFTLQQLNQQKSVERLDSQIQEASKVDPRLNDKSLVYEVDGEKVTYGQIVGKYVIADPNAKQNPVLATQKAIKLVDALIGHAKAEGKKELSASASAKAAKFPATNSSPQGTTNGGQPKSIKEAYQLAKEEHGF